SYNGDGSFNASTSAALTQSVGKGSSSISLVSSVNPSVSGQSITLTATVTAVAPATGTPTATVTFFDGATNLGSAALDASGQATLSSASLSVRSHSRTGSYAIYAQYGGDTDNLGSTSPALTQDVYPITLVSIAVATLASSNPSVPVGLSLPYTATGSYSGGSTADITSQASWASSSTGI